MHVCVRVLCCFVVPVNGGGTLVLLLSVVALVMNTRVLCDYRDLSARAHVLVRQRLMCHLVRSSTQAAVSLRQVRAVAVAAIRL